MKKTIVLIILLAVALILGDGLAGICRGMNGFSWLAYGKSLGITDPFTVEFIGVKLTLGFMISLNISQIIFLLVAIILYPKVVRALD